MKPISIKTCDLLCSDNIKIVATRQKRIINRLKKDEEFLWSISKEQRKSKEL